MPRITRWFPVSHDINQDPEVWQLTDKFGDRALRVWLEMLSIGDRNDGLVGMTQDAIITAVSYKVRCKRTKVVLVFSWITTQRWLVFDDGFRLAKYAKYHRTREPKKLPSEPSEPDRTKPDLKDAQSAPSAVPKVEDSRKLSDDIKLAADPIYWSNPEKFQRLIVWIKEKEKRDYPAEVITTSLRLFWEREQKSKVADWWPYLNRIFSKQWAAWNEKQAAMHKAADASFVRDLVRATAGVLKA